MVCSMGRDAPNLLIINALRIWLSICDQICASFGERLQAIRKARGA